jgi:hypothetical protein
MEVIKFCAEFGVMRTIDVGRGAFKKGLAEETHG